MQLYMTALALAAHLIRSTLAYAANLHSMDDIAPSTLLNSTEAKVQTRASVPHDLPEHPHCTYRGKDSLMYMVFSKDFGRHDETSQGGCGKHMLLHLKEECSDWIVNWSCIETPKGEHSAFMEFKVPIQTSNAGPECVEKAFRRASGPNRQQTVNCCKMGDLSCRKRNCEAYREKNADLKCMVHGGHVNKSWQGGFVFNPF